ncbi:DNRLRE domain-containing protein [Streptomyces sp. NPDC051546]|uniref:DNRLRE domain-containing protein n=1 Tax=Streptomyces sp. NPDC051546 TaxID=3365655 RepID=UPI0037B0D749
MALAIEAAAVGGTAVPAIALPAVVTATQSKVPGPAEASDPASAALAARLQNRRIEALSERTENSTTWLNPNGSTTLEAASGPVRFKDTSGAWRPVDTALVRRPDGSVAATSHPLGLKLAGRTQPADAGKSKYLGGGAGQPVTPAVPLVVLEDGGQRGMTVSWRGTLPEPELHGSTARYADALPATDLVVEATRTGYEQFLQLKNRSAIAANGSVTMSLTVKGLKARANADSSVSFLDANTGLEAGSLPAPVMWDATVDPRSGEHTRTAKVGLKVTQEGSRVDLTLTPDAAFLADPATAFPVTVDPAVSVTAGFDTFVQQGYTTDESHATELKLGNNGSNQVARSFLSFPMAKISGKQIQAAKLNLYNSHSWSCGARSWEVWDTATATSSTRWTAQPGWGKKWATSTQTKGYGTGCADGWVNVDVTSLTAAWAANGNSTNTLGIRATDEKDEYAWKRFSSGNASSNNPYLSVTYNTKPGLASVVSPLSGTATADTTPTLSGKASDPDGNTVQLSYEIWAANGTAALQTGKSAFVTSGTNAPWTPSTALAPGSYKWRAAVYDGSTWNGGWSAWQTFTVDTTAPAVPSISSTAFPAGQWSGTPDGSGNFTGAFTFAPPTNDAKAVEYRLDGAAWTSAATTGAAVTKTLTFRAGKHTLGARTKDSAGNASAEKTYLFSAGGGAALTSPGQGERPARRLTLTAQGKDTDTGVRYQYRRGELDGWHDIPPAAVHPASNPAASVTWPVAATGGAPSALVWNITDTLVEDGPVDVRAVFTDGSATDASPHNTVTVDRKAGAAPAADIGPGSVNLLTGDYTVSSTDANILGLTVSRSAASRGGSTADQEGQAPIFGPEWNAGTVAELTKSDWSHLRKTSATSVAVVDIHGTEVGFTAAAGGTWRTEPGAGELTLTGALTGTFTLRNTDGVTTTFTKVDPAMEVWNVSATARTTDGSTTDVVAEKVTVGGKALARPRLIVSPTPAVSSATCTTTPATRGCRVLEYVYADASTAAPGTLGDYAGRVKEIRIWVTSPGASASTPSSVARYAYDEQGRLREGWDPRISPALKNTYTYDTAGRVTTFTPAGEFPWTFSYGKAGNADTAGEGMLLKASRPALKQGEDAQTQGTAASTVVYDVPLTGAAAPLALDAKTAAAWGQSDLPSDATAVFPPGSDPAGSDGAALTSAAYGRATITYINASGREVNRALPGGGLTTTEYDRYGNIVRELSAGNRELALGTIPGRQNELEDLGINSRTTADRAELLSTVSVYSPDGQRETDLYRPLHGVTLGEEIPAAGAEPALPAGSAVPARSHTRTSYDEGRPADSPVSDRPTTVTTGALIEGYPQDADRRTSASGYDWTTGQRTKSVEDPNGRKITTLAVYDAQGRLIKNTSPKSNGTDAGTKVTTYWAATGTGTCQGRPEWAGLPCSTGPAGAVVGGGANPSALPVKVTEYDRWGTVERLTETANGRTRTSTITADAAGRALKTTVAGGDATAVEDSTLTYSLESGQVVSSTTGNTTITKKFDKLGRLTAYDDGAGNVTTTEYDALDRPVKVTDSAPSTRTYQYDPAVQPSGAVTATTDSDAGTFTPSYDIEGNLNEEQLPGGLTLTITRDQTGDPIARTYRRTSDGAVVLSDAAELNIHGQVVRTSLTSGGNRDRRYDYDTNGSLLQADDTSADETCTRRTYGFDASSNRTSLAVSTGQPDTPCTDEGAQTTSYTYDSADRLTAAGTEYDAFGRTVKTAGSEFAYFANDMVRSQTTSDTRKTWTLDGAGRLAGWATEGKDTEGKWVAADRKDNHYGDDSDSPAWVLENTSPRQVNRFIQGSEGTLAAIAGEGGSAVAQLTDLHGDIAVQYPVDTARTPQVLATDEYGNVVDGSGARYGWLGSKQRSTDTADGTVLMGARLYSPSTGRFLSQDSVPGGSCNDYDYVCGDPVNKTDTTGTACRTHTRSYKVYEGGVSIQIGTIGMRVEVCTKGTGITNSYGSSWGDESGVASGIGWSLSMNSAYRNVNRYAWVQWKANGKGQVCMFKFIPICGYQERFEMKMDYYTSAWFGYAPARNTPVWTARCTNSKCKFRFKR